MAALLLVAPPPRRPAGCAGLLYEVCETTSTVLLRARRWPPGSARQCCSLCQAQCAPHRVQAPMATRATACARTRGGLCMPRLLQPCCFHFVFLAMSPVSASALTTSLSEQQASVFWFLLCWLSTCGRPAIWSTLLLPCACMGSPNLTCAAKAYCTCRTSVCKPDAA